MLTDIPWISEVCCSMLPSDLTRTQQADQLYELLSEIQSHLGHMKLRRRGIHFHVQFRDVHKPKIIDESSLINEILPTDKQFSYLPCSYTDSYLENTHPRDDLNANYCEPSINDLYSELYQDQCDLDFVSDVSLFPAHLRDLLEEGSSSPDSGSSCGNDEITFRADINERVPIPQQFQTDKIIKSTNPVSSQLRNASFRVNSHHSTTAAAAVATGDYETGRTSQGTSTVPPPPPLTNGNGGNGAGESSAEYMSSKIHKFRSTVTALKKSDAKIKVTNSATEIADLVHSTRSSTAELMLNGGDARARNNGTGNSGNSSNSNSNNTTSGSNSSSQYFSRGSRH